MAPSLRQRTLGSSRFCGCETDPTCRGLRGRRPESGVRVVKGRARFQLMAASGGGTDVLGTLVVPGRGDGACPELAGRVEQAAAQVLQQPEPAGGQKVGVRVPPSAPSSQARCRYGSGFLVALGAMLGATRHVRYRTVPDSAATGLSPSSRGFNVRQVRDRLAMAAGAGCAPAAPVASQEKTV
jgi:hypothetical protein